MIKEVGDNLSEWRVMKKILLSKVSSANSISDLSRKSGIQRYIESFNKVVNYLIETGVINVVDINGKSKIITINRGKLEDYMRKRKIFQEVDEFIHKTTLGAYTG